MARQAGPLFITGTVDDVVFYHMNGQYYMRLKGEPTPIIKKRMSQKEHYPVLYMRKQEFKQAAQWVRRWYYTHLPKNMRKHGLFGTLTGKAVRLLRKGVAEEEIRTRLLQELGQVTTPVEQPAHTLSIERPGAVKAIPQPSYTPPIQKQKGKRATASRLSAWQVSDQGQLRKEVQKQKATVPPEAKSTKLYTGYYSTSSFSGW